MTKQRVDELLDDLRGALAEAAPPFTSADKADRVYEGWVFSQVVAAAADAGAIVTYEDSYEREVKNLKFRGSPGLLHRREGRFTHAVLRFGNARPLEVHLRVKVRCKTLEAESDVLVIDTQTARDSRSKEAPPVARGCALTIECKYYLTTLPIGEATQYLGVRDAYPPSMPSLFVTNAFSATASQALSRLKWPYEFGVMPATRFQDHVRSHIREAFKRYVVTFDPGHQI